MRTSGSYVWENARRNAPLHRRYWQHTSLIAFPPVSPRSARQLIGCLDQKQLFESSNIFVRKLQATLKIIADGAIVGLNAIEHNI